MATTIYADAILGNDANIGLSIAQAVKTVTKALTLAPTLLRLKSGVVFPRDPLLVPDTNPNIVVDVYGGTAPAVLDGSYSVKGTPECWIEVDPATLAPTPGSGVWLTVGDVLQGDNHWHLALDYASASWRPASQAEVGDQGEWTYVGRKLLVGSPAGNPATVWGEMQVNSPGYALFSKGRVKANNLKIVGYRYAANTGPNSDLGISIERCCVGVTYTQSGNYTLCPKVRGIGFSAGLSGAGDHAVYIASGLVKLTVNDPDIRNTKEDGVQIGYSADPATIVTAYRGTIEAGGPGENPVDVKSGTFTAYGTDIISAPGADAAITAQGRFKAIILRPDPVTGKGCTVTCNQGKPALQAQETDGYFDSEGTTFTSNGTVTVVQNVSPARSRSAGDTIINTNPHGQPLRMQTGSIALEDETLSGSKVSQLQAA